MKKENKWIVAVVCAVVAAALVVALVLLLPGQGEDQPQVSAPTGDVTEPSDPGNVTEPSDTAGAGTEEPGTDHVHTWTETVTAPDCAEGGYTTFTCACGESYTDNETRALGHDWADATCKDPRICKRCDTTEGKALGHNYNSVVTEPTKTEQGYTTHTCTRCGDSYRDGYTNLDGKQYAAGTMVFRTDGVASLYGENGRLQKTYTGWTNTTYHIDKYSRPPWYEDRRNITKVVMEDGLAPGSIEAWFASCTNLTQVQISNAVTSIGDYAFYDCPLLQSVTIPSEVTYIGNYAFNSCFGLTDIHIPGSVVSIFDNAFSGCNSLVSVTFAENSQLTKIGGYAFSNCEKLVGVELPVSLISVGDWAFAGCEQLTSLTVAAGNPVYHSQNNCVIETQTKTLVLTCNSSVIPADGSVSAIAGGAFANCDGLVSVSIPVTVTRIDKAAFEYCDNLTSISFQGTMEQWKGISKADAWYNNIPATKVDCLDGSVII